MRYQGGKSRIAGRLVQSMAPELANCSRAVDLMCGALNWTVAIDGVERVANDACVPLINLYVAWLQGWRPPKVIDETLYAAQRASGDKTSPLTAFLAFGCSYSGAWWNGWAKPTKPRPRVPNGEVFADAAIRSLDRKLTRCADVKFSAVDFRQVDICRGDLVYCDPEYRGTKPYDYFSSPFPHDAFVSHLDTLAAIGAKVFVSEYAAQAPSWELVADFGRSNKRSSTPGRASEKLFRVRP